MDKEQKIISYFAHPLNGDDGAVCGDFVFSKDLFIEGVHFKRQWLSYEQIGAKAALINISDAIAMNAKPCFALLGLAIPKNLAKSDINALCAGIKKTCAKYNTKIIGGDTTSSDKIIISLSIIAKKSAKTLFRKGAKEHDFIAFTGNLGSSQKGLKTLLNAGKIAWNSKFAKPVLRGEFVSKATPFLRCGMDISDGLINDVPRLLKKRTSFFGFKSFGAIKKALWSSGEEYEMLVIFSPKNLARVKNAAKQSRTKLTIIGKVANAKYKLPRFSGFKHF